MSEKLWFSSDQTRRVLIRSYAGLVGKAPTKQKRIKILITMPVTGQVVTGYPGWLEEAITFVMKHGQVIKPTQVIPVCHVPMSDANLFQPTPIEAPNSRLSHFTVENMASEEDPITVVKFQVLTPFSTDLLRWCGQMAGEEFDSKYVITEGASATAPDEDEDAEEDALAGEGSGIDGEEDELVSQARRREENKQVRDMKQKLGLVN